MLPFEQNVSSRYGAPMGRPSDEISGDVHIVAVPMVDGGYDPGGAYWGGHGENGGRVWCAYGENGAAYLRAKSEEKAIKFFRAEYPLCIPDNAPRSHEVTEENIKRLSFSHGWLTHKISRGPWGESKKRRMGGRRTIARRVTIITPDGFRFGNDEYMGDDRLTWRELFSFCRRQIRRYDRLCGKCPGEGACDAQGDRPCRFCAKGDAIMSHLSCVMECLKIEWV